MTTDLTRAARPAAGLWGLARAALGAVALAKPMEVARPWVGRVRPPHTGAVLARALGGRDISLGVGMAAAAATGRDMLPWIIAGGAADAVDTGATIAAWRRLPRRGRLLVLVLAGGSTVFAVGLAVLSAQQDAGGSAGAGGTGGTDGTS
ncbi:hypothetical protein [Haloechinothrix halophila]|uniref:hypothetical protein n=1 Tax=Haloechinothrix halophila TaxID=1069073 RepID=UPI00040E02AF|nr:hypothetical protein [Haloechinothrix halophila]